MVLLDLLHRSAGRHRWRLVIAHFNHRLRGRDSAADLHFVRRRAQGYRWPFAAGSCDVRRAARNQRVSLEMAARTERHEFLAATATRLRVRSIVLAHHADDQVELFFLKALRGSSPQGLGGMHWVGPSPAKPGIQLIRPLLGTPREALRAYAVAHRLRWREDPSNQDTDILRNRVRNHLLPALEHGYQTGLVRVIPRLMDALRGEHDLVRHEIARVRAAAECPEYPTLHPAVQRGCIHDELRRLGLEPSFDLIERLRQEPPLPTMAGGGVRLVREGLRLVLQPPPGTPGFALCEKTLTFDLLGGAGEVNFGGKRFRWRILRTARPRTRGFLRPRAGQEWFDADRIGARVTLRHWRPGDRFQPSGMAHPVKLQNLFINNAIGQQDRHDKVLALAAGDTPFWVEGLRISELYKLDKKTLHLLKWEWHLLSGPPATGSKG